MKRTALGFLLLLAPLALTARTRAVRSGPIDSPAAWLRHQALSHDSLARKVAHSDVVALGDVTHATHATYAAKQALVPLLVARGFRACRRRRRRNCGTGQRSDLLAPIRRSEMPP